MTYYSSVESSDLLACPSPRDLQITYLRFSILRLYLSPPKGPPSGQEIKR